MGRIKDLDASGFDEVYSESDYELVSDSEWEFEDEDEFNHYPYGMYGDSADNEDALYEFMQSTNMYDDPFDEDDDPFYQSEREDNPSEHFHEARSFFIQYLSSTYPGQYSPTSKPEDKIDLITHLLIQAEVYLSLYQYRLALYCALNASWLMPSPQSDRSLYIDNTRTIALLLVSSRMIQVISFYQLNCSAFSRRLRDQLLAPVNQAIFSEVSESLLERFTGTCEVLDFMPLLKDSLKSRRLDPEARHH